MPRSHTVVAYERQKKRGGEWGCIAPRPVSDHSSGFVMKGGSGRHVHVLSTKCRQTTLAACIKRA